IRASNSFFKVAEELIEKKTREGLAEPTLEKMRWFVKLLGTDFGKRPVTEITPQELLHELRKHERRGRLETACIGVIDMDLLSVIRRWHFRQGIPIREIKRRTGLSRNTIRKYLRADAVEPVFKVPARPSKLAPFAEKLTGWLRVEAGKSRKQKRTAKQIYADLVVLGYDGSYCRVAAFARDWKRERQYEQQTSGRGTFVPLAFQPGEAFQFDWSEDYA
ncbi:hypothetical protein KXX23_008564, partial [Aspergillus fumigatus]